MAALKTNKVNVTAQVQSTAFFSVARFPVTKTRIMFIMPMV